MSDEDVPSTPLSLLLRAMREKWIAGDRDAAAELARAAAPYIHARQAAIRSATEKLKEVHRLNDAELTRLLALFAAREPAPESDKIVNS
jgi:hypothetical protein